jgi:putative addiction module component (TIGR02574 family)
MRFETYSGPVYSPMPLSDGMKAELDRRLATADAHIAASVPWETVRAELVAPRK